MILLSLLLTALTGTVLIEVLFALLLGVRTTRDIMNIILVNIMTNPFLVIFSFMIKAKYGNHVYYPVLLFMEVLAVLSEGYIYSRYLEYKRIRPYFFSLILNLLSYTVGLLFIYM